MDAHWWCDEAIEMHVYNLPKGLEKVKFDEQFWFYKTIILL